MGTSGFGLASSSRLRPLAPPLNRTRFVINAHAAAFNPGTAPVDINLWTIRDDGSDLRVIVNGAPLVVPAEIPATVHDVARLTRIDRNGCLIPLTFSE